MLGFLLILFFLIWVGAIFASKKEAETAKKYFSEESQEKRCPPHKWEYNSQNRLQCETCKYISGSDHSPRGSGGEY